jgi:hypothetical protein
MGTNIISIEAMAVSIVRMRSVTPTLCQIMACVSMRTRKPGMFRGSVAVYTTDINETIPDGNGA